MNPERLFPHTTRKYSSIVMKWSPPLLVWHKVSDGSFGRTSRIMSELYFNGGLYVQECEISAVWHFIITKVTWLTGDVTHICHLFIIAGTSVAKQDGGKIIVQYLVISFQRGTDILEQIFIERLVIGFDHGRMTGAFQGYVRNPLIKLTTEQTTLFFSRENEANGRILATVGSDHSKKSSPR